MPIGLAANPQSEEGDAVRLAGGLLDHLREELADAEHAAAQRLVASRDEWELLRIAFFGDHAALANAAAFAAVLMPFLFFVAPRVTQSLHPQTVINTQGKILMDTPTKTVFFAGLACFTGLFVWLLSLDARSARLERLRASGT